MNEVLGLCYQIKSTKYGDLSRDQIVTIPPRTKEETTSLVLETTFIHFINKTISSQGPLVVLDL